MNLENLGPIFTKEELEATPGFDEDIFLSWKTQNKIQELSPGLFSKIKETRFGALRAGLSEQIAFLYRLYPQSFLGGASIYNSLGLSSQVPAKLCFYTNHAIPFKFSNISIHTYPYPIKEKWRKIYPLVDYIIEPYAFSDVVKPEDVIKNLLNKEIKGKELDFFDLIHTTYPQEAVNKVKELLK